MAPAIELVHQWPVDAVAAASVIGDEVTTVGTRDRQFPLASLTKLMTALAVLIAAEEGTVSLDDDMASVLDLPDLAPLRIAELLAHSAGLAPDSPARRLAAERQRRIYSNAGYELAADAVTRGSGIAFETYLTEAVFAPLGMRSTALTGSPAASATSTIDDLARLLRELHAPRLVSRTTNVRMVTPHQPGLPGILPGFGRQADNSWGLGAEIRGHKSPHWTGSRNSPETYGHFGRAGTFAWWDPTAERGLIVLTTREFGEWARVEWPRLSDAVLSE
ncbi:MAG TPA: serine hydrolase domain-containing protein [Acidimicrobiales bacterium]|nr:serine hydrolase domain-containing protein [Acidimicrobiales bacterium]